MYLSVPGSSSNSPVDCRTSSLKIFIAALENALTAELLRNLSFGCVNSVSSGCHTDMDFQLFQQSGRFICQELATMPQTAAASFLTLRQAGQDCEQRLLQLTGGVNTQKGLLFLVLFLWQAWVSNTSWRKIYKQTMCKCLIPEAVSLTAPVWPTFGICPSPVSDRCLIL